MWGSNVTHSSDLIGAVLLCDRRGRNEEELTQDVTHDVLNVTVVIGRSFIRLKEMRKGIGLL